MIERRRGRQRQQGAGRSRPGSGDIGEIDFEQPAGDKRRVEVGGKVRSGYLLIDGCHRVVESAECRDVATDALATGRDPTQPAGQSIFSRRRHAN